MPEAGGLVNKEGRVSSYLSASINSQTLFYSCNSYWFCHYINTTIVFKVSFANGCLANGRLANGRLANVYSLRPSLPPPAAKILV